MSNQFSLEQMRDFLSDNVQRINAVHKELEEIQIGFNSAYVEWKADHDAALGRLGEAVIAHMEEVGPVLQERVQERVLEEQRIIDERMKELPGTLIPQTQDEADSALREGQLLVEKLRQLNPQLDKREERLKDKRIELEKELEQLNQAIHKNSRGLGVVTHFIRLTRLDRERQQVIGKLKALQEDLKEVRELWKTTEMETDVSQEALQVQWQELTLKLAQLQGEMDYLEDETSREALALQRAVRHVLDALKEPIQCPDKDIKLDLDEMVKLNIQVDDYDAAFAPLSGMISVLEGIVTGMARFTQSIEGLIDQQEMHSAYLPKLEVTIPQEVLSFHDGWEDLRMKVHDDGRLSAHPAEFLSTTQSTIEKGLSEERIKAMFEGMGSALERATEKWSA
jgi:hypothetical protein